MLPRSRSCPPGPRPCPCPLVCSYEDAPLGMEAIRRAGFLKAVLVTQHPCYPKLQLE